MGQFILFVIALFIFMALMSKPQVLVTILITGAIGYVIGDNFSEGWSIYGAILGALIGWTSMVDEIKEN